MDLKLTGKRVLVTGGNSGLGAAMVRAFAAEHARVAINYVAHPEQTTQLAAELSAAGAEVLGLEADVSRADAVAAMFLEIDAAWGGLDVLVNNAGIDGQRSMAWEADAAAWSRVLQINLAGAYGVRVLCIAPGAIRTAINAEVWQDAAGQQDLISKIAIGRVGEPQDVAGMAVVLASDIASYVTGTSVFVDGGMTDYPAFSHGG